MSRATMNRRHLLFMITAPVLQMILETGLVVVEGKADGGNRPLKKPRRCIAEIRFRFRIFRPVSRIPIQRFYPAPTGIIMG